MLRERAPEREQTGGAAARPRVPAGKHACCTFLASRPLLSLFLLLPPQPKMATAAGRWVFRTDAGRRTRRLWPRCEPSVTRSPTAANAQKRAPRAARAARFSILGCFETIRGSTLPACAWLVHCGPGGALAAMNARCPESVGVHKRWNASGRLKSPERNARLVFGRALFGPALFNVLDWLHRFLVWSNTWLSCSSAALAGSQQGRWDAREV